MVSAMKEESPRKRLPRGKTNPSAPPTPAEGSSLKPVPRDEMTRKKIVDVIDHQFDVEILLKHQEIRAIEEEIRKAREALEDLRYAIINKDPPPEQYSTRSTSRRAASPPPLLTTSSGRVRRPVYGRSQSQPSYTGRSALYAQREDGTFVKLSCPKCHRDDFANHQGFLNHCRIVHHLEFASHDEANRLAGIPVDESEVPPDHPCRRKLLSRPFPRIAATPPKPAAPAERPKIKVFEEEVDMDVDEVRAAASHHLAQAESDASDYIASTSTPPPSALPESTIETASTATSASSPAPATLPHIAGKSGKKLSRVPVQQTAIESENESESGDDSSENEGNSGSSSSSSSSGGSSGDSGSSSSGSSGDSSESESENEREPGRDRGPGKESRVLKDMGAHEQDVTMHDERENKAAGLKSLGVPIAERIAADGQALDREMLLDASERTDSNLISPEMGSFTPAGIDVPRELPQATPKPIASKSVVVPVRVDSVPDGANASKSAPAAPADRDTLHKHPPQADLSQEALNRPATQDRLPNTEVAQQEANRVADLLVYGVLPLNSTDGSRFYVKRRVIVGNVSKFVPPERRDPAMGKFTHKWMIYVASPANHPDVATFLSKVRFYLHPSYRPHDVVDVKKPPFHLKRYGWGEAPVRVQLHFVDRRNKPVDIIHVLKLDDTHCGRQVLGTERVYDLELDRNTEFVTAPTQPSANEQGKMESHTQGSEPLDANQTGEEGNNETRAERNESQDAVKKTERHVLEDYLQVGVTAFPIVRPSGHEVAPAELPYACAEGAGTFLEWGIGRQRSTEWHRAHLLRKHIQNQIANLNPTLSTVEREKEAAQKLTTKEVMLWCRRSGHTPRKEGSSQLSHKMALWESQETDSLSSLNQRPPPMKSTRFQDMYCKFCGSPRSWHTKQERADEKNEGAKGSIFHFACSRQPAEMVNRRSRLSSLTVADVIMQDVLDDNEGNEGDDEMEVEVDDQAQVSDFVGSAGTPKIREALDWLSSAEPLECGVIDLRGVEWVCRVLNQLKLPTTRTIVEKPVYGAKRDRNEIVGKDKAIVGGLLYMAAKAFLRNVMRRSVEVYRLEESEEQPDLKQRRLDVAQACQSTDVVGSRDQREEDGVGEDEKKAAPEARASPASEDGLASKAVATAGRKGQGASTSRKLLVPYHVYQALVRNEDEFDFLTGRYMLAKSTTPSEH
ncbi:uncharacterized protein VTP21DRAFT_838 [Calcarisporiella thermophila]|uniref:uncharacterized protein n=1 Tax=Calcarisporiella thermophila TaxID=911321 RepID=UPI0037448F20